MYLQKVKHLCTGEVFDLKHTKENSLQMKKCVLCEFGVSETSQYVSIQIIMQVLLLTIIKPDKSCVSLVIRLARYLNGCCNWHCCDCKLCCR